MEEKKSHTEHGQPMPEKNEREIWFSALAADDAQTYDVDKAFDRFIARTRQKRRTFFSLPKIAYGAAAIALLFFVSTLSCLWGERRIQARFAPIVVEVPLGAKTKLVLPDSTLVWLNAGSRISYSQGFGVRDRQLRLDGEAYFEVKKHTHLPFDVQTKEMNVTVLGTKFNFRNYPDDDEAVVELLEGKVQLENQVKKRELSYLTPSEKVTLNKATGEMAIGRADVKNAKEWTNDGLFFDEIPLADIAKILSRSYNVKICIADERLARNRFYAFFNRREHTLYEVLDRLTSTHQLKYKVEGDTILLYGK